jgi:hypothetical protein
MHWITVEYTIMANWLMDTQVFHPGIVKVMVSVGTSGCWMAIDLSTSDCLAMEQIKLGRY